jgi:hypothetical protein
MITSFELVCIRFLTVRIQSYKLLHHLTVRIHSSPPAGTPAAATTAPNAGAATVATGGHITWRFQKIAEENEVDRRSRYVFLILYDFFNTVFRLLIHMFFANHIRTCIMELYVGATYTNSYHLRLATIYKLVYVRKILRICMITSYKLVYIRFSTVQIQSYKLVHHLTIKICSSPPHPKEEA